MRDINQKPETHESYGLLSISRTTGTPRPLFGTTIRHGNTIVLNISEAQLYRDFQKNRYRDSKTLIEVEMSPIQFAEAITSMNIGCGVPVTLRRTQDNHKIADPPEVNFQERAKSELKNEMGELAERVEELSKDAKEILSKSGTIKAGERDKILKDLMFLVQEIRSNIPFAHECFQEAVEETVTEAKATVDAALVTMREKLGQQVLEHNLDLPKLIENSKDKEKNNV